MSNETLLFPLSIGAATLLVERPAPEFLLPAIAKFRATVLFMAPTSYRAMAAEAKSHDLSSLRKCVSGGEALPAATRKLWREATGIELIDGIGSTEMLHIFLSNRPGEVRYGTTGKPVPGYHIRLVNEDGNLTATGELGELQISGPSSATQYWNNRARSLETFIGAWTRAGDKYSVDADGYYTYGGRSDDPYPALSFSPGHNFFTAGQALSGQRGAGPVCHPGAGPAQCHWPVRGPVGKN